jgi:hypothetical protein
MMRGTKNLIFSMLKTLICLRKYNLNTPFTTVPLNLEKSNKVTCRRHLIQVVYIIRSFFQW